MLTCRQPELRIVAYTHIRAQRLGNGECPGTVAYSVGKQSQQEGATVRAAYYNERGEIGNLQVGDHPKPEPGDGEVLIHNRAAAVGIWDVNVMRGIFGDPPLPMIPGSEVAGIVEAAPDGSGFKPGDEVYGSAGWKARAFAEYVTVPADHLTHKPASLSFSEASSLVVSAGTAYEGLIDRGKLQPGETVLITAASGAVGTAAVQIAVAVGARVVALASAVNHDHLRNLGASNVFDYHDANWTERVRAIAHDGIDVLFDGTANEVRDRAAHLIKHGGRGVFITGPPLELRPDIQAHVFSADINRDRLEGISRLVEQGKLKAHISAEVPLDRAPEAMERVSRRHTWGRVVLTIG